MVGVAGSDINEYTLTSPFSLVNISGEHTGDVIDTNSTSNYDTDIDVETLTVTAVRLGQDEQQLLLKFRHRYRCHNYSCCWYRSHHQCVLLIYLLN